MRTHKKNIKKKKLANNKRVTIKMKIVFVRIGVMFDRVVPLTIYALLLHGTLKVNSFAKWKLDTVSEV